MIWSCLLASTKFIVLCHAMFSQLYFSYQSTTALSINVIDIQNVFSLLPEFIKFLSVEYLSIVFHFPKVMKITFFSKQHANTQRWRQFPVKSGGDNNKPVAFLTSIFKCNIYRLVTYMYLRCFCNNFDVFIFTVFRYFLVLSQKLIVLNAQFLCSLIFVR